jgi:hypothetical protein
MLRHKLAVLLSVAALAVAVMTAARTPQVKNSSNVSFLQQEKEDKANPQRKGKLVPIDAAPEESDPRKQALRGNKNRRYNYGHGEPLMNQPDGYIYGRVDEASPPPPIPVATSDVIIVGTITKAQPYLDELKRSIYSEFTIEIEEVIKNNTLTPLTPNDSIVADRVGGALRLSNGRVLRYVVAGAGALPASGGRYLLFLKRIHQEQDLSILAGYELSGGLVSPLEDIPDREPYVGAKETDFLRMVRDAITNNAQSQSEKAGVQR